jgi:hypothetical protein
MLVCSLPTFANLPAATLSAVFPMGGRCGTELELTINGSELDEATTVFFTHPGLVAKHIADKKFSVAIAPDVPLGAYDVRVAGKNGVSNPRTFVVGALPEAVDHAANDKREAAVEIAVGSVFNGFVNPASAEYLKFAVKQGERVFIECATREIDSKLTPVLIVSDTAGRELAASRRDGFIDFTAPADGSFFLRLNDLTYAGGPESYFYRLALTSGPHIDFVFPPCGVAGSKSRFTLFGRALPGGAPANVAAADGKPLEKLEIEIDCPSITGSGTGVSPVILRPGAPACTTVDGFPYCLKSDQGASNPVFISLAGASPILELEPNNKSAEAQKVIVPCEIAGQFFPAGDVDAFTFEAKKGDVFWVEIFSHRLGLPVNPFLLVQREGANAQEIYAPDANIGGPRFNTATNDSATRIEVKDDGVYRVQARDLFGNTRSDPRCVYHLSIRKEAPDFRLAAVAEFPPKKDDDRAAIARAAVLRCGETIPVRIVAWRRDGFAGDIELSAESLPAGVACVPTRIAAGKSDTLLLLTASDEAARWVGPVRIVGKAHVGEAEIVREARAAVVTWNVPDFNNEPVPARLTQELALAVCDGDPAPISVEPAEDKTWEVAVGAKLEIPLKVTRRGGFGEPLKLKAFGAPAIETLKEIDIDPTATAATAGIDLATVKIPGGEHTIHFRAQTKGKFRGKDLAITLFSAPMRIVVK